jgi:dTDP-4-amino-4,6-dideoxygalactose transaminase
LSAQVPFLDLVRPQRELEEELVGVLRQSIKTAGFIGGPMVQNFEREFARFVGTSHSVAVGSGTDALRFALMAVGVKPGDTVLTVPNTFIATTEAISQAGAFPVFVDVDEQTYTMDPIKLQRFVETACTVDVRTGQLRLKRSDSPVTAIVPVHLYGQMADMDPLMELAERHKLLVVEDACQAHGAAYFSRREQRWRSAGTIGAAAAFSFYPGKNLGACGEAGAITTNDEAVAGHSRMLRDHGQSKKYFHDIEGYNGRLDAIQAGFLSVKLRHLARWNDERRACARVYDGLFADAKGSVVTPFVPTWSRPVYHLYVIQVHDRDLVQQQLANARIGTGIHYPVPLHLQKAFASCSHALGNFPVTERLAGQILSLPMFPHLSTDDQHRTVMEVLRASLTRHDTRRSFECGKTNDALLR